MINPDRDSTAVLNQEGKHIRAYSTIFKKQLGVKELVLAQILTVVGGYGLGMAAKLGSAHLLFWLFAMLLFFLPLASTVIYLNKLLPLEGGVYQWAKFGFNKGIGFMVAWNVWLFAIVLMSAIGLSVATSLSYAFGPQAAWMAGSKGFIALVTCLVVGTLAIVAIVGLGIGKWVHNLGGILVLLVFVVLLTLPFLNLQHVNRNYSPLQISMPELSLLSLAIFVKMAVFGLGGLEYIAILAGECQDPTRTITRSILIATPIIALMYILGTYSVLFFIEAPNVDLINPYAQVFSAGFASLGPISHIVTVIILLLLIREIAQLSLTFTGNTRLPMVAGWDQLLPAWFTRLHRQYKTPVNSVLFVSVITLGIGLAGISGVGQQEAYQLLQSAAGIFIASTQVVMFAIPLIGLKGKGIQVPIIVKVMSSFGLLITSVFMILSVFPIIDVESWLAYSIKIICLIFLTNLIGLWIYIVAEKRQKIS
jgi:glutamate:GABA antiporter